MNNHFSRPMLVLATTACFFISSCSDVIHTELLTTSSEQLMAQPIQVTINSLDDLTALFDQLKYNNENWKNDTQEIPRITFASMGEAWVNISPSLPVETKKSIFFRLMLPLILVSNENISRERKIVKDSPLDSQAFIDIAIKYRVIPDAKTLLNEELRHVLLARVDVLPPSLALAQAAEESGWGTSRFALEGNAFFGQWDFSGNGMKPKQQRQELGNYGVARFDSPLASVEGYMLNINTTSVYNKLRILRAEIRSDEEPINGYELASTLDKYSERGESYIQGLRQIITYNKLEKTDQAYLSNTKLIHLVHGSY